MGQLSMLFDLCYYCNMAAAAHRRAAKSTATVAAAAAAADIAILHARASR